MTNKAPQIDTASKRSAARRGTSAVEFALVAPVFLLFLMGIIEFGRVMMVQNVLITSAREGARAAIISGATADSVKDKAEDYASLSGVPGATASVDPSDLSTATTETPITVTVSVNFDDVSWIPAPWFLADQLLSGQTTMRLEGID
jgi:Flp pilus assembly protein TadG